MKCSLKSSVLACPSCSRVINSCFAELAFVSEVFRLDKPNEVRTFSQHISRPYNVNKLSAKAKWVVLSPWCWPKDTGRSLTWFPRKIYSQRGFLWVLTRFFNLSSVLVHNHRFEEIFFLIIKNFFFLYLCFPLQWSTFTWRGYLHLIR